MEQEMLQPEAKKNRLKSSEQERFDSPKSLQAPQIIPMNPECSGRCSYCAKFAFLNPFYKVEQEVQRNLEQAKNRGKQETLFPCNSITSSDLTKLAELCRRHNTTPVLALNTRLMNLYTKTNWPQLHSDGFRFIILIDQYNLETLAFLQEIHRLVNVSYYVVVSHRTNDLQLILNQLPPFVLEKLKVAFPLKSTARDCFYSADEVAEQLVRFNEELPYYSLSEVQLPLSGLSQARIEKLETLNSLQIYSSRCSNARGSAIFLQKELDENGLKQIERLLNRASEPYEMILQSKPQSFDIHMNALEKLKTQYPGLFGYQLVNRPAQQSLTTADILKQVIQGLCAQYLFITNNLTQLEENEIESLREKLQSLSLVALVPGLGEKVTLTTTSDFLNYGQKLKSLSNTLLAVSTKALRTSLLRRPTFESERVQWVSLVYDLLDQNHQVLLCKVHEQKKPSGVRRNSWSADEARELRELFVRTQCLTLYQAFFVQMGTYPLLRKLVWHLGFTDREGFYPFKFLTFLILAPILLSYYFLVGDESRLQTNACNNFLRLRHWLQRNYYRAQTYWKPKLAFHWFKNNKSWIKHQCQGLRLKKRKLKITFHYLNLQRHKARIPMCGARLNKWRLARISHWSIRSQQSVKFLYNHLKLHLKKTSTQVPRLKLRGSQTFAALFHWLNTHIWQFKIPLGRFKN